MVSPQHPPESSRRRLDELWPTLTPKDCAGAAHLFTPTPSLFEGSPPQTALLAYDGVVALALAMESTPDLTVPVDILTRMESVEFEGASGGVSFDRVLRERTFLTDGNQTVRRPSPRELRLALPYPRPAHSSAPTAVDETGRFSAGRI